MPIQIKKEAAIYRKNRILTAEKWGDDWTEVKLIGEGDTAEERLFGYEVISVGRATFSSSGKATVRFQYGFINERNFQLDTQPKGVASIPVPSTAGDDLDENRLRFTNAGVFNFPPVVSGGFGNTLTADTFVVPDILNYEIRIQENLADEFDEPEWVDLFWGRVTTPMDKAAPASEIPMGTMDYMCLDGTARLAEWKLNKHAFAPDLSTVFGHLNSDTSTFTVACKGLPGYNSRVDNLGQIVGNKSGFGEIAASTGVFPHTWSGGEESEPWTDLEAIVNALYLCRPDEGLQPDFDIAGITGNVSGTDLNTTDILGGANVWPTSEDQSVRDLMMRIFNRRRGILAYLDWEITGTNSLLAVDFVPTIRISPVNYDSIDETLPSGTPYKVLGAVDTTDSVYVDLDLTGDHRLGNKDRFQWLDDGISRYDRLLTRGERLTVVATATLNTDLIKRWTTTEQNAYDAAEFPDQEPTKYGHIYREFGFPLDWDSIIGSTRIDYRITFDPTTNANTLDDGLVATSDSSPMSLRVLDYLPLYEGWDYTTLPPVRYDVADQVLFAAKSIGILVLGADGTNAVTRTSNRISVARGGNMGNVLRITASGTRSGILNENITLTLALQFGHRLEWTQLRFLEDGVTILPEADVRRVKEINAPNLALHVADENANWKSGGTFPAGVGSEPPILRDDRDDLVKIHARAAEWYLKDRRSFRVSLSTVGGTYQTVQNQIAAVTDTDGNLDTALASTYRFPKLGEMVHNLIYAGRNVVVNSPVTSWTWVKEGGTLTIETNWGRRDGI
ncbi:MAG: hypothetical protein QQN63_07135 [Nitrosopumilus sp.]